MLFCQWKYTNGMKIGVWFKEEAYTSTQEGLLLHTLEGVVALEATRLSLVMAMIPLADHVLGRMTPPDTFSANVRLLLSFSYQNNGDCLPERCTKHLLCRRKRELNNKNNILTEFEPNLFNLQLMIPAYNSTVLKTATINNLHFDCDN